MADRTFVDTNVLVYSLDPSDGRKHAIARQTDIALPYMDPVTGNPMSANSPKYFKRGPFRTWDDLYFRVVKPVDTHQ